MPADDLDHDGPVPVYRQLAAILRERIRSGEIPPGRRIPSKKTLTQEYGISGKTVDSATRLLKDEGLIRNSSGLGLFVTGPVQWSA
jgi:GntR family transcriptional regulator